MANLFCYGRDRISGGEASRTKKRCLSKRTCERVKEISTGEILPICPLVKEVVNKETFPNIPNLPKTSSKNSANRRIYEVFRELIARQQPTKEFITWCAHRDDVLQDCMNLIEKDLKLLPKRYEKDYPITSPNLEKLIKQFYAEMTMYRSAHNLPAFMLPPIPDEFLKDYRDVLAWQEEKENPDESLYTFLATGTISGMASLICHYPAVAIKTMNRIFNELFSLEKIEIEKAKSEKPAKPEPQEKGGQPRPEPLSKNAQIVFDILKDLSPEKALTTPEILDQVANKHEKYWDEKELYDRVFPQLRPWGLKNKPRKGYWIEKQ